MSNFFIAFSSLFLTSIYSIQFTDVDGNNVSMSAYQGKKILLVNIATGSSKVNQLEGLQQLHQTYGDSLIIIAFPSNSFGHEARTNAEIKQFCTSNYAITFKIASKSSVSGAGIQSIYSWLANISDNGVMNGQVVGNFQKFLIDNDGSIAGIFAPSVEPMDQIILDALARH